MFGLARGGSGLPATIRRGSALINRRQQGDLGEISAIEWLTGIGATVLIPFGHSPHFDLWAEIHNRLARPRWKRSGRSLSAA